MKKILLCLCMMILVGCQKVEETKQEPPLKSKENLIFKDWKYISNGDANEEGYYFIKPQENGPCLISYYDYQSKQEVFLCHKPECQHQDETCTAYINGFCMGNELFVYNDYLYMIESNGMSVNTLGEREEIGSGIIRMDLDGQNKKEVYRSKDGYGFEHGSLVLGDGCLYIPFVKSETFETGDNATMQVSTEKYLGVIDLETGENQNIMDMKDKHILGTDGRTIIMDSAKYSEDPYQYLNQKDFKKYDQIILNSRFEYVTFDIDTRDIETISVKDKEIGTYYQNKIYTIEKSTLYALDLKTHKKSKILDLKTSNYHISNAINNHLILEKWDDNFIASYKVSLDKPELIDFKQYTRSPKEPVTILAQMKNQLLVIYDRVGQEEKTWAGTMQFETKKEYIGLISIEDYLNNKKNYQLIKTLTETRFS